MRKLRSITFVITEKEGSESFGISPQQYKKDIAKGGENYDHMHEVAQKHLTGDISHIGKDEKHAIARWTQPSPIGYKDINNHVRRGVGDAATKKVVGHLTDAVNGHSLPHDTWGYRGVGINTGQNLSKLKTGDLFHNKGFASASLDPNRATHFAKTGHMLALHIPEGSNALYVNHPKLNGWSEEREMLLPHNTHYRYSHSEDIEADEHDYSGNKTGRKKKVTLHHAEVIPHNENSMQIDR